MATSLWSSLKSSLTNCSKSLKSRGRSPQQVSSFKLFQKIRKLNVIESFIKSTGQPSENFSGWLSSEMTSSTPSRSFQDLSSTLRIRMSKILIHLAQVCQSDKRLRLRHGASASSQESRRQVSRSDCQLFRFRLGRLSKITKINKRFINFGVQCLSVNIQSTSRTQASIAHSSAESELYAMTQASVESLAIKNFIQEFSSAILSASVSIVIQTDSSAGKSMASRLGISRRSKHIELKYLWIQDEIKEGKLELKKVGTHFNPSDVLTKYVPASVLGQHLPRLNIFKVHSQRSKSVLLSAQTGQSVQCSSHPQPPSTSTSSITPTPLSVFMFSVNLDHQEHLRQRLSQASRRIKRVLTPPRRGSGDQESIALRRQHVSHQDSEVQENQESSAGVSESIRESSDSGVHGQRHVPPQNHESTSQWSSWIRSCFSVSVSLSSLSWRRRQDQGRNQENQEEINQRLSHLYLRAFKSHVICLVLFSVL